MLRIIWIRKKRKIEIAKIAKEKKIVLYNLNPKTYLKKHKPKGKVGKKVEEIKEKEKEK